MLHGCASCRVGTWRRLPLGASLHTVERRQALGVLGSGLGVLVLGYAIFAPESDEERILAVLDELALSVSFSEPIANPMVWGLQLGKKFEDLMTEQIDVRVSEVRSGIPSSRSQLGPAAGIALQRYGALDITFSGFDVQVQDDRATAEGRAEVTGVIGGEKRSDARPIRFELIRLDGEWLVHSVHVRRPEADSSHRWGPQSPNERVALVSPK